MDDSYRGAQMKALQQLKTEQAEIDRVTWAPELVARRHEKGY